MKTYSRIKKEQLYRQYRDAARTLIKDEIADITHQSITLTEITPEALNQAAKWKSGYVGASTNRSPGWIWKERLDQYRKRPRRVELAIWVDPTLCGLVLGRVSEHRVVASIHFLEANPDAHPLRSNIAIIATRFLDALAAIAGCSHTAIDKPVEGLLDFYKDLGFKDERIKGKKVIRLVKSMAA